MKTFRARLLVAIVGMAAVSCALGARAVEFTDDPAATQEAAPPEKAPPLPVHTIEGVGGGGITPMAYLVNPGDECHVFGKPAVWASDNFFSLSKQEDIAQKRAAMVFVKWMSDNSWMWAQSGQIPVRKSALRNKKFTKSDIYKYQKPFADEVGEVVYTPLIPAHGKIFSEEAKSPLVRNIQAAMLQRKTPKQALDDCVVGVNKLLAPSP